MTKRASKKSPSKKRVRRRPTGRRAIRGRAARARRSARRPRLATAAGVETTGARILAFRVSLDAANDAVMTDCNAFVKKVGAHFGVVVPDKNADGIVDAFAAAPFSKTTTDAAEAMGWAADGLVVAGMRLNDLKPKYGNKYTNGHVAIVHDDGDARHPGFSLASWGLLGGRGASEKTIRQSFPFEACDDRAVHFAFASVS